MALERFHFETADGTKIEIPYLMDAISRRAMRKINKDYADNPEDMDEAMFKAAGIDDKTLEIIDNMSMRDYTRFFKEWSEQEDAGLGES